MEKGLSVLNNLLRKKGVTAYRLCKDTGIPQSTVSSWRRGTRKPNLDNLLRLADYFGVDVKVFLNGN